jgi:DNA polymerase-3 subunit epsilon
LGRLPSLGIASLAGYFGAHLEKRNRARHHVAATETIYDGLVQQLEARGIICFTDLDTLLREPISGRRDYRWVFSLPRSARLGLPAQPGVYRFRDARGQVLYVGKATSLKDRVNSYFQKRRGLSTQHRELLTQVAHVQTSVCTTAVHAALLECREIQRHEPRYNRHLKTAGRQLVFCNQRLEKIAAAWSPLFFIGPFPSPWIPESLNSLFHLLQGHRDNSGLFANSVAMVDLEQGLTYFRKRLALKSMQSPRDLLAQGLHLLRHSDCEDQQEDTVEQNATDLIPTKLGERCQRILLNAARHYQRARWLTRLLAADVHWQDSNGHHAIRLTDYITIPLGAENWAGLGVETYDLARTLLSEIHRLRASGLSVALRLSAHHAPDPKN